MSVEFIFAYFSAFDENFREKNGPRVTLGVKNLNFDYTLGFWYNLNIRNELSYTKSITEKRNT